MSRTPQSKSSAASRMGIFIVLGIGIGTMFGAALNNVAMGVALGAAGGALIGGAFTLLRRK